MSPWRGPEQSGPLARRTGMHRDPATRKPARLARTRCSWAAAPGAGDADHPGPMTQSQGMLPGQGMPGQGMPGQRTGAAPGAPAWQPPGGQVPPQPGPPAWEQRPGPPSGPPPSGMQQKRSRTGLWWGLGAAALVVIAAAGLLVFLLTRPLDPPSGVGPRSRTATSR